MPSFSRDHHAAGALPSRSDTPYPQLTVHVATDADRAQTERCVQEIYAQRYGALVPSFAPVLVALREQGDVVAVAGYRQAAAGPLFLENYLPAQVEVLIAAASGAPVRRDRIVEVGHLAGRRAGAGRQLMERLGLHLAAQGCEWVVGTVTRELRAMLVRLDAIALTLGAADPAALGNDSQCWGSYYEHEPVVVAIHLRRALRRHATRQARASSGGRE